MKPLHCIFDWDGTLSFIRAGWGDVMLRQWMEFLPALADETTESRSEMAHHEIWALNGRPSIHQMERLAELVRERGGIPLTPNGFQDDFQARLGRLIRERMDSIRSGERPADHYMVLGGRDFLGRLQSRGVRLHVVSGTPRPYVSEEIDCLGLRGFFDQRVHGPTSLTDTTFHKRTAIRAIIAADGLDPATQVLSFGDGVAEIVETLAAGGRAVAVAADEEHWHSGRTDLSKEKRLLGAGAEFCIPDYTGVDAWWERLGVPG